MKKWNVYKVYAEDSADIYKMIVPAPSKKDAMIYVADCGLEIIKAVEMSELKIDVGVLSSFLITEGFDSDGVDVISRILQMVGLAK